MKIGGFFIALVFALAACSSAPQPREPTATTTPAPAPSSTATAPAMPAQATEDSPEGAAAFVDYWIQALNYAAATGDTLDLDAASADSCRVCQDYIETFDLTYDRGGYYLNAEWTPGDLTVQDDVVETYVTFVAQTEPGRYRTEGTAPEKLSTGTDTKVSIAVAYDDKGWTTTQLGLGDVK